MDRDASIEEQYRSFVDSINRATDREIEAAAIKARQVSASSVSADTHKRFPRIMAELAKQDNPVQS